MATTIIPGDTFSHFHSATDLDSGTVATVRLGSGVADATVFLRGDQTWAAPSGGSNHNILSATHPDATAAAVVRGDIITGIGATPTWQRLAIGGATTVLHGGTEPSYSAVATGDITDSAVTTAKVNNAAVTYAKIQDVTAVRLLGREDALAGSPQEIALSAELRFDTTNDWLEVSDSGIITGLIADSAITTVKILDSSVTYAKMQAVTASRLLGRHDTTTGIVEEISVLGGLSFDTTNDALTSDSVVAASLTVSGRSEHATPTEINTATDTLRAMTPNEFRQSNYGTRIIEVIVSDTTLTTGDGKARFNIPSEMDSWDLVDVDACVDTNTSGVVGPTFQINNETDNADMLSTKITLDTSEVTSFTAATQPVIDTANDSVVTGNRLRVDIDSAGTASGLRLILSFRKY